MPDINATKNDLLKAIRMHCDECMTDSKAKFCTTTSCKLYPYRMRYTKDADQTHLFRVCVKEDFDAILLTAAESFGYLPFYWSDLRRQANCRPLHDNWWGGSAKMLQKHGYRVLPGNRPSKIKSRNGGSDRCWIKMFDINASK